MSSIKNRFAELVCIRPTWVRTLWRRSERGMATAEYAIGILAAVAFALVLLKVFRSNGFLGLITQLVAKIISTILGFF
ncbi:MAG: DUF4244 domain-containing protein [Propionibacteriaceae bacterium]|jgi:hypothetical protein|nr:DUF4244 domain-containing protein [Propionibacteriaceae bacterium]